MFERWDSDASVRSRARRIFRDERAHGMLLFPAQELPYLAAVRSELDEFQVDQLIAQRLFEYLNFTLHLETHVVNRSLMMLAHGDVGFALSDELRLDAYRIYTDEAYHATCTLDMMQQVAADTGYRPVPYRFSALDALDREAEPLARLAPGLPQLLQATVFETVITAILSSIPQDMRVVTAVRELIADHAIDERRHHAYFARLFPQLWAGCPAQARSAAGVYLAHVLHICLAPDLDHALAILTSVGLPAETAQAALARTYTPQFVGPRIRRTARHTLKLLAAHGIFDDPDSRAAFAEHGLLPARPVDRRGVADHRPPGGADRDPAALR
jgi:hypothetical protein